MLRMFGIVLHYFIIKRSLTCLLVFLYKGTLKNSSQAYKRLIVNAVSILGYLEFDKPEYFEASSIVLKDEMA
jgi:hypothetical protein